MSNKIFLYEIAYLLVNRHKIKYGDNVFVHPNYKDIENCDFRPDEFIYLLKTIVGAKGNIEISSFDNADKINDDNNYKSKQLLKKRYRFIDNLISIK
ncbi:MAG: hypothetical protein JW866_10165 [Ignavibacteriales bacterium]|nr:hypothetical protein [Ignavibacteriales bacterium]